MSIKKLAIGCAVGALLASANTHAILITINNGNTSDQPANEGDTTVKNWLQADVTAYNTANNPDLPTPVSNQAFRINPGDSAPAGYPSFGANTLSITLPTAGYDYLVLHWGGQGGGLDYSYYIGNIGGPIASSITFEAPTRNGLSYYAYFNPEGNQVPDAGASAALLGLGVGALGIARRYLKK